MMFNETSVSLYVKKRQQRKDTVISVKISKNNYDTNASLKYEYVQKCVARYAEPDSTYKSKFTIIVM